MISIAANCLTCSCGCGVTLRVEEGRVVEAVGRESDPVSHGFICPKGRALSEIENAPDRLRTPLRRRPGGGWDEIGWEEALDEVAERIAGLKAAHGPESVAVHVGESGIGKEFTGYAQRFCSSLRHPQLLSRGSPLPHGQRDGLGTHLWRSSRPGLPSQPVHGVLGLQPKQVISGAGRSYRGGFAGRGALHRGGPPGHIDGSTRRCAPAASARHGWCGGAEHAARHHPRGSA